MPTKSQATKPKLYVLDTCVLLHDPSSLRKFEENHLYVPMQVLSEMDKHKSGHDTKNLNARQAARAILNLVGSKNGSIAEGYSLNDDTPCAPTGRLFLQSSDLRPVMPPNLAEHNGDNLILAAALALRTAEEMSRLGVSQVILVTKDVNMHLKAAALGLTVQDYRNDQVLQDADLLPTGYREMSPDFWGDGKNLKSWKTGAKTFYQVPQPKDQPFVINEIFFVPKQSADETEFQAIVREVSDTHILAELLTDYTKRATWGIHARNRLQNFALNLLLDPSIHQVSIAGKAGSGKTLLTLAAGLAQCFDVKQYHEIVITRATVELGGPNNGIGWLPGDEDSKMGPWFGAVHDSIEVLVEGGCEKGDAKTDGRPDDWGRQVTSDLIMTKLKIKAMALMRGRTFHQRFLIIDEAQNLTAKEMKALITRAGPGTKVVCLGNLAQIDTPYLSEGSSGLTHVATRMHNRRICAHLLMQGVERSELAELAEQVL